MCEGNGEEFSLPVGGLLDGSRVSMHEVRQHVTVAEIPQVKHSHAVALVETYRRELTGDNGL